jgi:hypothetical protein
MFVGRKARHIRSDFRNDARSCDLINADDAHEQLCGFLERDKIWLDFSLSLSQSLIEKIKMGQDTLEQYQMMGSDASIEYLAQVGPALILPALRDRFRHEATPQSCCVRSCPAHQWRRRLT